MTGLTYSLADQNFDQTKSVGIFNVSTRLLEKLAESAGFSRLNVLSNSTLNNKLRLPASTKIQCHDEAIHGKLGRIIWDQWGLYEAAKKNADQWIFLPKGFVSFLRKPPSRLAVYIYDTVHNFYQANYPYAMPRFEGAYFTRCLRAAFRQADVIFTDSDFANNELKRLAGGFGLNPPAILTAGIGFTSFNDEPTVKKRESLLVLTSSWPHKLTARALNFIERWQKQTGFSAKVDLVGSLPAGITLPGLPNWQYHSRLSERAYRQFLAKARLLLFFSEYEGFGMPPVEAMIAGACPVFSDIPVTQEVMGGRGFPFSNNLYESFVKAMDSALKAPEDQIESWAEQLLERHNWDKVVKVVTNGLKGAG